MGWARWLKLPTPPPLSANDHPACGLAGIVTETGSGANGVSGRTSAWLPLCYRRHRFPPEIIQHAIWPYLRFTLSYRDVEELLAERGLDIS